jgi:hypothetical protein
MASLPACSVSAIMACRRTTARYSFDLIQAKVVRIKLGALTRKSDLVRVSKPGDGGVQGNAVSHSSWQQQYSVGSDTMGGWRRKGEVCHVPRCGKEST